MLLKGSLDSIIEQLKTIKGDDNNAVFRNA